MKPYIVSLLAGILAGAIYSLVRVRSPAPPMIALVGLLGMVIGTQLVPAGRQFFANATLPVTRSEAAPAHPAGASTPGSVTLIAHPPASQQ
jgi:XapX domain-containing protein